MFVYYGYENVHICIHKFERSVNDIEIFDHEKGKYTINTCVVFSLCAENMSPQTLKIIEI